MANSSPTLPQDIPDDITEKLTDQSPDVLRDIARFADELAEHRGREAQLAEQDKRDEDVEVEADRPDDIPSKATITVKEINDHRYYYWQWREGDQVKSKYKGPVDSS